MLEKFLVGILGENLAPLILIFFLMPLIFYIMKKILG